MGGRQRRIRHSVRGTRLKLVERGPEGLSTGGNQANRLADLLANIVNLRLIDHRQDLLVRLRRDHHQHVAFVNVGVEFGRQVIRDHDSGTVRHHVQLIGLRSQRCELVRDRLTVVQQIQAFGFFARLDRFAKSNVVLLLSDFQFRDALLEFAIFDGCKQIAGFDLVALIHIQFDQETFRSNADC